MFNPAGRTSGPEGEMSSSIAGEVHMTVEQANYIRILRVDLGFTWRKIAECFDILYPDYSSKPVQRIVQGNQINLYTQEDGRLLCDFAIHVLDDDIDNGWN
jgi:hypothetical protein